MSRTFRGLGGAALVVALATTATPALAKPPTRPGAPSNLAVSSTKSGSVFDVHATWSAATNATRYNVRLSSAGVTLDSSFVTTLSWTGHTTKPDGAAVVVT